jgi:hypothetical protein
MHLLCEVAVRMKGPAKNTWLETERVAFHACQVGFLVVIPSSSECRLHFLNKFIMNKYL